LRELHEVRAGGEADDEPDRRLPEAFGEQLPEDVGRPRAERHSHADLGHADSDELNCDSH